MKYTTFRKPLSILLSSSLLFLISACGGPNDKDIQANVAKALQSNPALKGVTSNVKDGVVTLSGACQGEGCDSLAEQQVKKIDGVKSVKSQMSHEATTDLTLRTTVQSIVSRYDGVQADVAAGVVVLRGTIEKKQVEALMNELQALKPKKLDNQLAVK
ncbi:BON domain-containing protein [Mucilaginibacter robiniae]|uniref:BON domain-containing protein n=1 Tax=Mucilaginibacter robiniae TaxID=2728022 RepID=A0A7L5DXB3_9SPHI|nr:BON domain-containing protein [Mucilaginibacter robiniae]QJD95740.1 BON domain-containing protein [Mucilaginibacter robiniae]